MVFFLKLSVSAQIEISTNPFRFDSDTRLRYRTDHIDKDIVELKGTNITWNLKNIESPLFNETSINVNNNNTGQTLKISEKNITRNYRRNKSDFDETGLTLRLNSLQSYNYFYNKPISFSYKKLKYGAKFSEKTSFDLSLSREELPSRLQRIIPEKIRDIKIIGELIRNYHCDASGRFILEEKNLSALRLKVIEKVDIKIYDIYSGSEIHVNDNNALNLLFPGIGTDIYYLFYTNSSKLHFARISSNKNNADFTLEFQDNIDFETDINIDVSNKDILLYPNPTYGLVKIMLPGFSEGTYTIDIYNVIGKKIWTKQQAIDSESIFKFDFSFLRKGTYLLSVKDRSGNSMITKRLIIIGV